MRRISLVPRRLPLRLPPAHSTRLGVKCRDGDVTKFRAKSSAREENAWVLGRRRMYICAVTKRGTFRVK